MESIVKARIDSDIKAQAESNLQKMGLNNSSFIRMMYYSVAKGEFPLEMKVPTEETLRALQDIKEGRYFKAKSVDDLMEQLKKA